MLYAEKKTDFYKISYLKFDKIVTEGPIIGWFATGMLHIIIVAWNNRISRQEPSR